MSGDLDLQRTADALRGWFAQRQPEPPSRAGPASAGLGRIARSTLPAPAARTWLPGPPSRAETVAHWERASGFRADALPCYEVFAAWRMAMTVVMARTGTLFTQGGVIAPEAAMDRCNGAATPLAQHAARLGF